MPKFTKLKNGLTIAIDKMQETDTVSISIWTKVGSRHEKPSENGLSHFLEHMAFKGTKSRTAKQIAEEFDNIGGHFNAFTSYESTVFYAKVLKEDFATAADILSDIIQNSIFLEEELEKERNVILQEIAMTNDNPDDIIFDYYQEAIFKDQPLGRSILGTEELVGNFTRDNVVDYINKHYFASNIIFSVAGNIEEEVVLDFAEKNLSSILDKKIDKFVKSQYFSSDVRKVRDLEQIHLILGFQGVSFLDKNIYVIQILAAILGGGMSSRLFQEVRENRGLAYGISAFHSSYRDNGNFAVYASTSPKNINELIKVTCDEINKITLNIKEEELQRCKAQARAGILMARESSSARADNMGRHMVCFNKYKTIEEIMAQINKVTVQDLQKLAVNIINKNKLSLCALGPVGEMMDFGDVVRGI